MDRKSRKLLAMQGAHHLRADTDRLYMTRENRERGPTRVEDFMHIELESLLRYLALSKETMLVIVWNEGVLKAEEKGEKREMKKDMKKNHARKDYTISSLQPHPKLLEIIGGRGG